MNREFGALLLTVAILLLVTWAASNGGAMKLAATHPNACPPGTFLALDGFCTHVYRYTTSPPGPPPAATTRR